jgi:hypothetical protein
MYFIYIFFMSRRLTNKFTENADRKNTNGCSILCIFLIFIFSIFIMCLGNRPLSENKNTSENSLTPPHHSDNSQPLGPIPTRCWGKSCDGRGYINPDIRNNCDIFNDPYVPPVKINNSPSLRSSESFNYTYKQVGILTSNDLIIPLLGKPHINGREKWNYYTISNTGSLNTKLPIRVRNKICTNEYGCDEIFTGDIVFVEGYNRNFKVTIYENNTFSYDPFI